MQICRISTKFKSASPLIEYRPLEFSPQMHLFSQFLNNTQQQKFCPTTTIIIIIIIITVQLLCINVRSQ